MNPHVTILGAGLSGALMSIFLARNARKVVLYERRPDLRKVDMDAGRSINLALAARGIEALKEAGVFEEVEPLLIPMRGRILHALDGQQSFVPYGQRPHEVIFSVSRPGLNGVLLDHAQRVFGISAKFLHAARAIDFDRDVLTMLDERRIDRAARDDRAARRACHGGHARARLQGADAARLGHGHTPG